MHDTGHVSNEGGQYVESVVRHRLLRTEAETVSWIAPSGAARRRRRDHTLCDAVTSDLPECAHVRTVYAAPFAAKLLASPPARRI